MAILRAWVIASVYQGNHDESISLPFEICLSSTTSFEHLQFRLTLQTLYLTSKRFHGKSHLM